MMQMSMMKNRLAISSLALLTLVTVGVRPAMAQLDFLRELTGGTKVPVPPANIVAHIEIKGSVGETPVNMPPLFGEEPPPSLLSILNRLKEAKDDDRVQAVIIDMQNATFGAGQIEELNTALRTLKDAKKPVYIHADTLTTWTYAASVGASNVSLVPTGDLWLTGIYGEMLFLRGALEKLGMTPDFERCGAYKSAAETFMRTEPSPENEAMSKWLYDGLYDGLVKVLAESRNMTPDKMRDLINKGPYSAEDALKAGLIDSVKHRQDFIADIRKKFGADVKVKRDYGVDKDSEMPGDNFFAMFEFMMKMLNPDKKVYKNPTIAIVYVDGAINTGTAKPSLFGGSEGAFSTTIRKALDKAANEPAVKAVVLRVDSPGGSALASEIILDATRRVAAVKPLVVSMGNVAGSGGYYVTCASDTIFADRMTITSSIGVLGGKVVTTGMWDKLGVNWHPVKRGDMAAMMSTATPFSESERAKIRHYMESIYEVFKGHVVEARGSKLKKPIDEVAAGRVFTGEQALELGLVDRIGGLKDAIAFASQKAGVHDPDIRVIPEPASIFDMFIGDKAKDDEFESSSKKARLSLAQMPLFESMLPVLAKADPLRFHALMQAIQRLELLHSEGVITMMPEDFIIR